MSGPATDAPAWAEPSTISLATQPDDDAERSIAIPYRVGRYEIGQLLGVGGMGRVHEAHDPHLDRRVAIKLMPLPSGEHRITQRMRMLREAQALARLTHPHVVEVYDVGVEADVLFIAMELVDGHTLLHWLEGCRVIDDVLDVLIPAGEGLAAAHADGLVHRDFKPANVLVGSDGRVRLVDFGLARHHAPSGRTCSIDPHRTLDDEDLHESHDLLGVALTEHGAVLGTPAYMAPECCRDGHAEPASDQFAFCVTLFEAVMGARPFHGSTPAELRDAKRREEIIVPAGIRLPARLSAAIRRGLRADPSARWPSMNALLGELRRVRARRRRRRRGAAMTAGLLVSLGLLGAAAPGVPTSEVPACPDASPTVDAAPSPELDGALRGVEDAIRRGRYVAGQERLDALAPAVESLGDPRLLADLTSVKGRLLLRQGHDHRAEALLTEAYFMAREAEADAVALRAMIDLGELRGEWLHGARALVERVGDPGLMAEYAGVRARAHILAGEPHEALELLDVFLPRVEAAVGPNGAAVAEILLMRGAAEGRLGRATQGVATQRRALAILLACYGPDHLEVATGYNNLGAALWRAGDRAEARDALEQALVLRRARLDDDHPQVILLHHNLGHVLMTLGEHDEAIEHERLAFEARLAKFGPDDSLVPIMQEALGLRLLRGGYLAEAEDHLRQVEQRLRSTADAVTRARALGSLAELAQRRGDTRGAREHLREALALVPADRDDGLRLRDDLTERLADVEAELASRMDEPAFDAMLRP